MWSVPSATLRDGAVGAPVRVQDGIASAADDVDAAFSTDGRTMVFASKREGAKQLYLSHADVVVSRLGWSVEHLERFGRGKWAVPAIAGILFVISVRLARRQAVNNDEQEATSASARAAKVKAEKKQEVTRSAELPIAPERRKATVDQPQQRSVPAKNPLANWTAEASLPAASASTKPAAAKPARIENAGGSGKQSDGSPSTTGSVTAPAEIGSGRRRLLMSVVLVAAAAGLL